MIVIFFFLAGAHATLQCYNQSGLLTPSAAGTLCVECNLMGYVAPSGCVCYTSGLNSVCGPLPAVPESITTSCPPGFCQDDDGGCVLSAFGVRCQECGEQGYIATNPDAQSTQLSICICSDPAQDPNAKCSTLVPSQAPVSFNLTRSDVVCNFYNSSELGYYENNEACSLPYVGPPPNQNLLMDECDTYGGADPNAPLMGFYTCNNHGSWNATAFKCECDDHWTGLESQLIGVNDENVTFCTICAPGYGPPTYHAPDPVQPYCSVIYTPDPQDGVLKECSGHGSYVNGDCSCFFNATAGHWNTSLVDTVLTCVACQANYTGANCTVVG